MSSHLLESVSFFKTTERPRANSLGKKKIIALSKRSINFNTKKGNSTVLYFAILPPLSGNNKNSFNEFFKIFKGTFPRIIFHLERVIEV